MFADRNLLLGILALQLNFVTREQLFQGMSTWVLNKDVSLGKVFVDDHALNVDQHRVLEALVDAHIEKHGSAATSLNHLSVVDTYATLQLRMIDDADLQSTIACVSIPTHTPQTLQAFDDTPERSECRYRILRDHARGGLGEVFVAHDTELSREVALKEIQGRYADNADSRERFLREAEITGSLEHPGIVPVYGLGKYRDGRPYYAMRFIRGGSLKEAIESFHAKYAASLNHAEAGLELRKLLRRLVDVCNAIAYAHSRGVLHRDLKPANIVLGTYGETLVVDWGLSKVQGRADSEIGSLGRIAPSNVSGSAPTMEGSAVGTPAYMSPEQAAGKVNELSGATDVYSLGATLFHLLTGQLPIAGTSAMEIVRKAELGEIRQPRELKADIPKGLEAICLKAMSKLPGNRYPTPAELADDIENWLADERVSAYAEPASVKARRWIRRHPAIVSASTAVVLLGLCAAMTVAYLQSSHARELSGKNIELVTAKTRAEEAAKAEGIAKDDALNKQVLAESERARAEEREQQAIDAIKRYGDVVTNTKELRENPKLVGLRKQLLKEPLVFFKSLRERLRTDTKKESLERFSAASFELGNLSLDIGDVQDAIAAHQESLAVKERLVQQYPSETGYQTGLARSHSNLGMLFLKAGKSDEALASFEHASSIQERQSQAEPNNVEFQADLATIYNNLGGLLKALGKSQEARLAYEKAIAIKERLVSENPTESELQFELANSYNNLGLLLSDLKKLDEALVSVQRAMAIREQLVREHPENAEYQGKLSKSYNSLANLMEDLGEYEKALAAFQQAISIKERLAKENPDILEFQSDLAGNYNNLGILYRNTGRLAEALAMYEQALAIQDRLARENPSVISYQSHVANSYNNIGNLHRNSGQYDKAYSAFEKAKAIYVRLVEENPSLPQLQNTLGIVLNRMALIHLNNKKYELARDLILQAYEFHNSAFEADRSSPEFRGNLQGCLVNMQKAAIGLDDSSLAEKAQRLQIEVTSDDPEFAAIDARLKEVLAGSPANSIDELLALADRSYDLRRFLQAARFYRDALQKDAELQADRTSQVPYNAACCAAMAESGLSVGEPKQDEPARSKIRAQALAWLTSELDQWAKLVPTGTPNQLTLIAQTLQSWRSDSDLASLRDEEKLSSLPVAEQQAWQALWQRVNEISEMAAAKMPSN